MQRGWPHRASRVSRGVSSGAPNTRQTNTQTEQNDNTIDYFWYLLLLLLHPRNVVAAAQRLASAAV